MTCSHCESWLPHTTTKLRTRKASLALGGDIYPCPKCGGRDWAMSAVNVVMPRAERRRKMIIGVLCIALIVFCAALTGYFSR